MGVYINMEMPKDGRQHRSLFCFEPDGTAKAIVEYSESYSERHVKTFQMIEVPEHGRLIDAAEISEHKYTTIPPYRKKYADGKPKSDEEIIAFKFGWNYAIDAIVENASTIIEAEEG